MKKIECDRCGKQAEDGLDGEFWMMELAHRKTPTPSKEIDLCTECMGIVMHCIMRFVPKVPK